MNGSSLKLFFESKDIPLHEGWQKNWPKSSVELMPVWNQVHGVNSVEVTQPKQECGDADAVWTRIPGQPVGVRAADCVPILLAHRNQGQGKVDAVAAIHAGWRGTIARITGNFFKALPEGFSDPLEWKAWIGPSNRACCYEVSEELIEQFVTEFNEIQREVIEPKPRYLDLIAINVAQLKLLGVGEVETLPDCTYCALGMSAADESSLKYYSYRRGDRNTRQHSIISFEG